MSGPLLLAPLPNLERVRESLNPHRWFIRAYHVVSTDLRATVTELEFIIFTKSGIDPSGVQLRGI